MPQAVGINLYAAPQKCGSLLVPKRRLRTDMVHLLRRHVHEIRRKVSARNQSEVGFTLKSRENPLVGTALAKGYAALQFFAFLPTFLNLIGVLLC